MVISLSYGELVIPTDDAVTLLKILEKAERYQEKYRSEEEGGTTFHVFTNETTYHSKLVSDDLYRMAKLAGKPAKT